MSEEFHADYFATREQCERDLSRRATDARAAAAHFQMAEHYEAQAVVFGAKRRTSSPTA